MRASERWEYLTRAPLHAWDLLARGRYDFVFDFMPIRVRKLSVRARINLVRAALNLGYRRLRPWNWPVHMQVELTSYCNLRCPVCPAGTGELSRPKAPIAPDLYERLLAEVGPYLLTISLWAWGEPLLHPQLERILHITRGYPVVSLLSTNGQNLDREHVQNALRRYPPSYLIVAIDGLTDDTNSRFRQGARLGPALAGVRELADWKKRTGSERPVLHCRFMIMKHNQHELAGLRAFATDAGFDMVSLRTLSIIDSSEDAHRSFVPESEEYRAYAYAHGQRVKRGDFVCQHAFSFPATFADGTVVACEQDFNASQPYGVFGADRSFSEIWFGERAARVRRTIRDSPSAFSFCSNCPYADRPTSSCSIAGYSLP